MTVRTYNTVFYSCLSGIISLIVHLVLIVFADRIPLGMLPTAIQETVRTPRNNLQVRTLDAEDAQVSRSGEGEEAATMQQLLKALEGSREFSDLFELPEDVKVVPAAVEPFAMRDEIQTDGIVAKTEFDIHIAGMPPPEIIELEQSSVSDDEELGADTYASPERERMLYEGDILPNVLALKPSSSGQVGLDVGLMGAEMEGAVGKEKPIFEPSLLGGGTQDLEHSIGDSDSRNTDNDDSSDRKAGDGEENENFLEQDPSDIVASEIAEPVLPTLNREPVIEEGGVGGKDVGSIDNLMQVSMAVYKGDPAYNYFRLDIKPNIRSDRLKAISKDMLFLIDCSSSISRKKMKVFKTAVRYALEYLNPQDRFNIVSFRTEPEPLFSGYQKVSEENLQFAREYVDQLKHHGKTDVYESLVPFVTERDASIERPLNIFLLTDGNSTVKGKLDNEVFIKRIAEKNQDSISIYSVSCGKKTNRVLLDLLSVTNRGVPLYRAKPESLRKELLGFLTGHSRIIVSDLIYHITGDLLDDIYPRELPQLYRSEVLSLYGRAPKNTDLVGLQLLGKDATGETEELVFMGKLSEAGSAKENLKKRWIYQKAFQLLIQRVLSLDDAKDQALEELVEQYDLDLPYF